MVDIVERLCIKSKEFHAQNGDYFKVQQGKTYTTTKTPYDNQKITVFSRYWVQLPVDHFVLQEGDCND